MMQKFGWVGGLLLVFAGLLIGLIQPGDMTRASAERDLAAGSSVGARAPVTCTEHTTGMTLTVVPLVSSIGEAFQITATLANEGCGIVGMPKYTLLLSPEGVLEATSPVSTTHYLGLDPGETDTVTFTLRAIAEGSAAVQVYASFEVHLGYPGPAYWAANATTPLTVTVLMTEAKVLQQAASQLGCDSDVLRVGDIFNFTCAVAAGHAIDAQIERFTDAGAAQAEFAARQDTLLLDPFHCYDAYAWEEIRETAPQWEGWHSWVAERWIVTAHSVDDTGIPVAPAPITVSEAIYSAAIRERLFAACDRVYLPGVLKE